MKFLHVALALSVSLAGIGMACAPEEKYCFEEHMTCKQAAIDRAAADKAEADRIAAEKADAGVIGDGGATVID